MTSEPADIATEWTCGYSFEDGTLCGKPAVARWDHEMLGLYAFCREHDTRAVARLDRQPDPSWQRYPLTV